MWLIVAGSIALAVAGAIPAAGQSLGGPGPAKPQRPASAQSSANTVQVSVTAGLGTDYVNRGVSQTGGRPLLSVGVEAGVRGLYAGATVFHVDFRNEGDRATNTELDLYGGYTFQLVGQGFDLGVIHYSYGPTRRGQAGLNYTEAYVKTARTIGPATLGASFYYSPHGSANSGTNWYGVVSGSIPVVRRWTASALVGRQGIQTGGSYTDWNAGLSYGLSKALKLDLRYFDTDRHRLSADYHARAVAALQLSL